MNSKIIIIYSTIDDEGAAKKLATNAIHEGIAACVNIIPNICSVYKWQDKVEQSQEFVLIFKADYNKKSLVCEWLTANHPYEVPAVIALDADTTPEFCAFIKGNS